MVHGCSQCAMANDRPLPRSAPWQVLLGAFRHVLQGRCTLDHLWETQRQMWGGWYLWPSLGELRLELPGAATVDGWYPLVGAYVSVMLRDEWTSNLLLLLRAIADANCHLVDAPGPGKPLGRPGPTILGTHLMKPRAIRPMGKNAACL